MMTDQASNHTDPPRNKYHTLTLAEAKKLNRSLATGSVNIAQLSQTPSHNHYLYGTMRRAPLRTASVLHKPRAPPIVVTDLDTTIDQLNAATLPNYSTQHSSNQSTASNRASPQHDKLNRSASIRSASLCPTGAAQFDTNRHNLNYGRASAMNSRTSLYSAASSSSSAVQRQTGTYDMQQVPQRRQQPQKTPLEESISNISNLSFKSSLDTTDGPLIYDPSRMQTMSADLGSHYNLKGSLDKRQYDSMLCNREVARNKYNTLSNVNSKAFYDESYSSTYSNVSSSTLRPASVTPSKSSRNSMRITTDINKGSPKSLRSVSKMSLSASTYRVFQSPLANFRKFLRNMPRPFATNTDLETKLESHFDINIASKHSATNHYTNKSSQCLDQSLGELSISDSISQISLNKSQSPPVCPPPPGQLKSLCYMDSAINYSNYDEFTRSRNEKMAQRQQSIKENLNPTGTSQQAEDQHSVGSDHSEAWQLTSLPVYYERNLTTVFEEKHNVGDKNSEMVMSNNGTGGQNFQGASQRQSHLQHDQRQNLIRPPIHFDDNGDTTLTSENIKAQHQQQVSMGSVQSLNSCLTTCSAAGGHQPAPATPYRFSFAQPLKQPDNSQNCVVDQVTFQKNIGLPPRVPTEHRLSINTSELTTSTRQDNSSSGNSSNCSSQLNGMNNCDRPNSLDTAGSADKLSLNSNQDSTSAHNTSANNCAGYGNLNGLADNDADLTLLSETSTLQGDTGIAYYANKCAELERTVTTLKSKLIGKEKELTDLQLNQLNNDYTIERLKKQVGRLERENAQLRTIVASKS